LIYSKWWKKFFPNEPAKPDDPNSPRWLRSVAMLTGVLAGFAGYLTVRSTALSNDAIYHSTQAVLRQAELSDAWAEYQANSVKARIVETAVLTTTNPSAIEQLNAKDKDYRDTQPALKEKAKSLWRARKKELLGGRNLLIEKDLLGYSGMAVQLAIALASVAALTRKQAWFHIAIVIGALGIGVTGYAFVYHYQPDRTPEPGTVDTSQEMSNDLQYSTPGTQPAN
jgi:hypothetical protein